MRPEALSDEDFLRLARDEAYLDPWYTDALHRLERWLAAACTGDVQYDPEEVNDLLDAAAPFGYDAGSVLDVLRDAQLTDEKSLRETLRDFGAWEALRWRSPSLTVTIGDVSELLNACPKGGPLEAVEMMDLMREHDITNLDELRAALDKH